MTAVTLELPDDLVASLMRRADLSAFVAEALTDALAWEAAAGRMDDEERSDATAKQSLRSIQEYSSESAYVAAAVAEARNHGVEPEIAAALARGVADATSGRTISFDEYVAESHARRQIGGQRER